MSELRGRFWLRTRLGPVLYVREGSQWTVTLYARESAGDPLAGVVCDVLAARRVVVGEPLELVVRSYDRWVPSGLLRGPVVEAIVAEDLADTATGQTNP